MKVSRLIAILQGMKQAHGDRPVVMADGLPVQLIGVGGRTIVVSDGQPNALERKQMRESAARALEGADIRLSVNEDNVATVTLDEAVLLRVENIETAGLVLDHPFGEAVQTDGNEVVVDVSSGDNEFNLKQGA